MEFNGNQILNIEFNGNEIQEISFNNQSVFSANPFGGASFTDTPNIKGLGNFINTPTNYYNYGGF